MGTLANLAISILFIAIALTVLSPILDMILNDQVVLQLNNLVTNLEYFTGSQNLNLFLIIFTTTLLFLIYKRVHKFFAASHD